MKVTKIIVYTIMLMIIHITIAGCVANYNNAKAGSVEKNSEAANSENSKAASIEEQTEGTDSQDTNSTSFDINVSINVSVILADNLRNINPSIIKAARTALFNFYCDRAKFVHYNGFSINEQMNIFEVNESGENSWEVKYRGTNTPDDCFSLLTVKKEETGSYKGYMAYSSPLLRGDETF